MRNTRVYSTVYGQPPATVVRLFTSSVTVRSLSVNTSSGGRISRRFFVVFIVEHHAFERRLLDPPLSAIQQNGGPRGKHGHGYYRLSPQPRRYWAHPAQDRRIFNHGCEPLAPTTADSEPHQPTTEPSQTDSPHIQLT